MTTDAQYLSKSAAKASLRPSDIALLRASLCDGDEAKDAFHIWRSLTDFEGDHDLGQYRMLPLLHENMSKLQLDDPVMPRLRGVHRFSWCEARRREFLVIKALSKLQEKGIELMALKGLALSYDYYSDAALRPMQDIDLLVRIDAVREAVDCLLALGWAHQTPALHGSQADLRILLGSEKSIQLTHKGGGEIDLHWYPFHEGVSQRVNDRFWRNAEKMSVAGVELMRPSPSDLLLHVIVHGLRANLVAPLRWAADAVMVIRRDQDAINWVELEAFAARIQVSARLHLGLSLLREMLDMDIPLSAEPPTPSRIERFEIYAAGQISRYPGSYRAYWLEISITFVRLLLSENRRWLVPKISEWAIRRSKILLRSSR